MDHLSFVTTADGSRTLYHARLGEHYHSVNGALQESRHVFLESGLQHFLERSGSGTVSVLEVGFGTGLNFLLSADYCKTHNVFLQYSGLEAFPLTADLIGRTGYEQYISRETWQAFTAGYERALGKETALSPLIRLEVLPCRLQKWESDQRFDVLYFDAFAAGVQPEIWTAASLGHAAGFLKPGGVFVTYAMNGMLKKNMQSLGLGIEKLRGAAGKREMLRATRP